MADAASPPPTVPLHADSLETAQKLAEHLKSLAATSNAARHSVQLHTAAINGEAAWAVVAALRSVGFVAAIADSSATALHNTYEAAAGRALLARDRHRQCCQRDAEECAVRDELEAERASQAANSAWAAADAVHGTVRAVCAWHAVRAGEAALGALASAALALRGVVRLRLVGCALGPAAAAELGAALRRNTTLAELDVSSNPRMGAAGVRAILAGINGRAGCAPPREDESGVTVLNLAHCQLSGDEAVGAVADGIAANHTLHTLYFQCNRLSDATAAMLVRALNQNKTLCDFAFSYSMPSVAAGAATASSAADAADVQDGRALSESWRQELLGCLRSRRFARMDSQQRPPGDVFGGGGGGASDPGIPPLPPRRVVAKGECWPRTAKAGF